MNRIRFAALLLLALPVAGVAQSTAENLKKAQDLYATFQVEPARAILQQLVSSGYLLSITPEQKAVAEKYLGATYVDLGKPDSALTFFEAAIDFDPFTDLDPNIFSPADLGVFNTAKTKLFKVGIAPVDTTLIDPGSNTGARFRFITTQRAQLTVQLIGPRDTTELYSGSNDGLRDVTWLGVVRSGTGQAADTTYDLRATGLVSATGAQPVTDKVTLRIERVIEPLEDTLPPLSDTLPDKYESGKIALDLVKGIFVGAGAVGMPLLMLNGTSKDLGSNFSMHLAVGAALGFVSGVTSFYWRTTHRDIAANVAENQRRNALRRQFNDAVVQRNNDKRSRMKFIVTPLTGVGR